MKDKILSFERPTQVAFWDVDGSHYVGGIAYGTEIICGCYGGIAVEGLVGDETDKALRTLWPMGCRRKLLRKT